MENSSYLFSSQGYCGIFEHSRHGVWSPGKQFDIQDETEGTFFSTCSTWTWLVRAKIANKILAVIPKYREKMDGSSRSWQPTSRPNDSSFGERMTSHNR